MKLQLIASPVFVRKEGVTGCPPIVSFYGSMPYPVDNYNIVHKLALLDVKQNTTHNYFFGKVCTTEEDFKTAIAKLREAGHTVDDSKWAEIKEAVSV